MNKQVTTQRERINELMSSNQVNPMISSVQSSPVTYGVCDGR